MSTQIKATVPDSELERRAVAAYFRYGPPGSDGSACILDQPAGGGHTVEHDGKLYVVLSNIRGTLAVYRALPSGRLKGLRRPPAALVRR